MEFNYLSGSLAFEPFRLEKDDLFRSFGVHTTDSVGGKTSGFDGFDIPTDLESLFNDVDVDFFTDKFHPLDYLIDDEKEANDEKDSKSNFQNNDDSIVSPLGSPISSLPLNEFSYDLLEPIDSDNFDIEFFHDAKTSQIIQLSGENPNSSDVSELPELPELPEFSELCEQALSPDTSSPLSTSSYPSPLADHAYAKICENESENLNLLSPKSVDSGISTSYNEDKFLPDDLILDLWEDPDLQNSKTEDVDIGISEVTRPSKQTYEHNSPSSSPSNRFPPYPGKQKTEEQYLRRKEHNRKSALKYRTKKREKLGTVVSKVEEFEKKNKELKTTVEELQNEIDYLKGLVRDVMYARLTKNGDLSLGNLLSSVNS